MTEASIETDDGVVLEALIEPATDAAASVVICHPHPLHGGTMHAPLLTAIADEATGRGFSVLRFNFRGIGESTGTYGDGTDEIRDVTAAVEWLGRNHGPVVGITGWSFGAAVALRWQAVLGSSLTYVGVAPPVDSPLTPALPDPSELQPARRTLIVGDRDQFVDSRELEAYGDRIDAQTIRYETADHFFVLRHDRLARDVVDALGAPPISEA